MAEAAVSVVVKQLVGVTKSRIKEELKLVRGVKKEIRHISSELTTLQNVLKDAEIRGYKEKTIKHWLNKLEDVSYEIGDVLDEWNYAKLKLQIEGPDNVVVPKPKKVCPFIPSSSCLCFKKYGTRRDIAIKIKELKKRLDVILKEKDRYDFIRAQPVEPRQSDRVKTTSFVDVSEIHGREDDKKVIMSKLINLEGEDQEESGFHVISIVGTGGLGKTTLAQMLYNDDQVKEHFDTRIWICVSDVSDEVKIAKGIIEKVNGSSPDLNELDSLLERLADSISEQKFLLVLDDVWEEYSSTKWEPFRNSLKCCGSGSKVLVTTRSEVVAKKMDTTENDIHHLGLLSDADCWLLMRRIAFFDRSEEDRQKLQDIGRNIANKCKGLPLAAKVLGGLLRFKDDMIGWENVLESEIWQMEEVEVELFPHLYLSYNELSPTMKLCFSYCAVFPKDFQIDMETLIKMWMAQGYLSSGGNVEDDLESKGSKYFNNLRMRSFFQDFTEDLDGTTYCKVHDIVHDFAQFLRKNKLYSTPNGRDVEATQKLSEACDPSVLSQIRVYRSLICEGVLPFSHIPKNPLLSVLRVLECEKTIPNEIENLTQLRYITMRGRFQEPYVAQTIFKLYNLETLSLTQCLLKEIPEEIGNLINLRHLDLGNNEDIKELPQTLYNLRQLRTLNLVRSRSLTKIPEGIDKLLNLKHFINKDTSIHQIVPQGLEQLKNLETLNEFNAGRGHSKLEYLSKLDKLSGELKLTIFLDDAAENVIEAHKSQMGNKRHLQMLHIVFLDEMGRSTDEELMRSDVLEGLQPSPYLPTLQIENYKGVKFPGWMSSSTSLNHLKKLVIMVCKYCTTLPSLWELPYLEELALHVLSNLQLLSREFMGLSSSSFQEITDVPPSSSISASSPDHALIIRFPKLKKLTMVKCEKLEEWEDITAEEEENANLTIMPCLILLKITLCAELKMLPHRLLHKASSLEKLEIRRCNHFSEHYEDKEGSEWKLLSSLIPHIREDRVDYKL